MQKKRTDIFFNIAITTILAIKKKENSELNIKICFWS